MVITLINCMAKLQPQSLIPSGSGIVSLENSLQSILPLTGWMYSFTDDMMEINVSDGTTVPSSLSNYGDVVV